MVKPRPRLVLDADVENIVEVRAINIAIFAILRLWVSGWDVDPLPAAIMIGDHHWVLSGCQECGL